MLFNAHALRPPLAVSASAAEGMVFTWYRNGYRWQYFLLASGCSTGAMVVCMVVNWFVSRCGVKATQSLGGEPNPNINFPLELQGIGNLPPRRTEYMCIKGAHNPQF
eukprot:EG_transcript_34992